MRTQFVVNVKYPRMRGKEEKMKRMMAAAALAGAGVLLVSNPAKGFTFDDIHYWVGEGTNRCAVVVDWAGYGVTKAWGYRWNGTCTNAMEVVERIAHEDSRLKMCVQKMTESYCDFYFFGYDTNDCHPTWDEDNGAASDPEALAHREDSVYYTAWWVFYGPMNGNEFPTSPQYPSSNSANTVTPTDGDWFVFSYGSPDYDANWNASPSVLNTPAAAETPYGFRVVASATTAEKEIYRNPNNVLGHPTMYMYGMWGGPVSPVNPAWMEGELFSLESYGDEELEPGEADGPGFVIIEFDHDVMDDPANPYGLDFIVFGNAMCTRKGNEYYGEADDPGASVLKGEGNPEYAKVEVSADGTNWFTDPDWKFADDFAPTLGYLYEPSRADPTLYSGNRWWGRAAHATRPVNPNVDFSNCANKTLTQVCNAYNGSAGGTGYDISRLDLPKDAKGRRYFRYVRISSVYQDDTGEGDSGYTAPDIDAVADVAPVSDYELWAERNYTDWMTAWRPEVSGPDAIAANGKANGVNFILGLDANETGSDIDFRIASFTPGEAFHTFTVDTKKKLSAGCGIVVKKSERLSGNGWKKELPIFESSVKTAEGWTSTFKVSSSGGKFLKLTFDAN